MSRVVPVSFIVLVILCGISRGQELKNYKEKIPDTLVTVEMVAVPGGQIKLPGAASATDIKPFYIGKTELPWEAYDVWAYQLDLSEKDRAAGTEAKSRPSKPYGTPDRGYGHDGYPALGIPLHAAQEYCKWLSKKTGKKYRLPTEAEWEYACRGGAATMPTFTKAELEKVAWFADNSDEKAQATAKKDANKFGLYDMLGNVAEWVMKDAENALAAGGAWNDKPEDVSCSARKEYTEEWQSSDPQSPKSQWWLSDGDFVGFRIVCEP